MCIPATVSCTHQEAQFLPRYREKLSNMHRRSETIERVKVYTKLEGSLTSENTGSRFVEKFSFGASLDHEPPIDELIKSWKPWMHAFICVFRDTAHPSSSSSSNSMCRIEVVERFSVSLEGEGKFEELLTGCVHLLSYCLIVQPVVPSTLSKKQCTEKLLLASSRSAGGHVRKLHPIYPQKTRTTEFMNFRSLRDSDRSVRCK